MSKILIFFIGLFIGTLLGIVIMALMITARRNDEIICKNQNSKDEGENNAEASK